MVAPGCVCMQCYVLHEGTMADPCRPLHLPAGSRGELKPRDAAAAVFCIRTTLLEVRIQHSLRILASNYHS